MTVPPQTLPEAQRRVVAAWAADCAERALSVFEAKVPGDGRPRALIARARAYAGGELSAAVGIRLRFTGGAGAGEVGAPGLAAARAAGQAAAVCHMGAHALGAAAYALEAVRLANPDRPEAADEEICWQLAHMSKEVRRSLSALPRLGEDRAGPLGPGLLSREPLAAAICASKPPSTLSADCRETIGPTASMALRPLEVRRLSGEWRRPRPTSGEAL